MLLPVDSELQVNPGILRSRNIGFLDWILEADHPYQFIEEVGVSGNLCERFLKNAK
jgi:hypothetical protein